MRRIACLLAAGFLLVTTPLNAAPVEDRAQQAYTRLADMRGVRSIKIPKEMAELRPKALREQAERLGVQTAFRVYYSSYEEEVEKHALKLDQMFNFSPLLLHKGHVRPPVLTRAGESSEVSHSTRMTKTGSSYRILKPAAFVSVPPSWRDYLILPEALKVVEEVHPAMLPLGSREREIWREGVDSGWKTGREFAERMFRRKVNELERDIAGLMLYKELSLKGFVSTPVIAENHVGVQVGDTILEFDQQEFRITQPSHFQKRDKWR